MLGVFEDGAEEVLGTLLAGPGHLAGEQREAPGNAAGRFGVDA